MCCLNFEDLCRENKGSDTTDGSLLHKSMVVDHQPCKANCKGRGIPTLPGGVYLTFDTPAAHVVIERIMCCWLGRRLNGLASCSAGRDQNESWTHWRLATYNQKIVHSLEAFCGVRVSDQKESGCARFRRQFTAAVTTFRTGKGEICFLFAAVWQVCNISLSDNTLKSLGTPPPPPALVA